VITVDNNLDYICFEHGTEIFQHIKVIDAKKCENLLQKTLGILEEDGIFAFCIYLISVEGNSDEGEISLAIQRRIEQLFRDSRLGLLGEIDSQEKAGELKNQGLHELQSKYLAEEKQKLYRQLKDKNLGKDGKNQLRKTKDNINSFVIKEILSLTEDINTLLFAKSLMEKTLIYARYQAKSLSD
jgi:hypothetical protein